ncbi:MAG: TrmH family RNA methyltransferase [Chitinophagaceae bacterium]|nr:TrmH family RNA methyltransferase [Chitinophagaceae bacterium]
MRKLTTDELNRLSIDDFQNKKKHPLIIILDNVRSMHNIGSIFRTADAFAIEEIILVGITASPPQKEIQKTALGATDSVKWQYFKTISEAILYIQAKGFRILVIEQTTKSTPLQHFSFPDAQYALCFGNEINGVSEEFINHSSNALEIPQFGTKHSFNIVISVGITLWHYYISKKIAYCEQ